MQIGNAPCSWGVFYPTGNAITGPDYLDAVAAAGYSATELGPLGFLGEDAGWIGGQLAMRGLTLTGAAHVHTLADPASAPQLMETLHRLGRLLRALDCPHLILMDESEAYPPTAQGVVDEAGWRGVVAMIGQADRLLREAYGITLHIHPHVGTCIEREAQIDRLLAETPVSLCFDTGHHAFWDQDVLAFMARIRDRIGYLHLKNVDPVVRARVLAGQLGVNDSFNYGVMCPLQDGVVDIAAVMRLAQAWNFAGPVVVEQDPSADAVEPPGALARRNLTFLQGLAG